MRKLLFTIKDNVRIARGSYRMQLSAPEELALQPGQFVDIALEGLFLRRPISICDAMSGDGATSLTLVYKSVGEGTSRMASMQAGEALELLAPLGNGFDTAACRERALLVGGGVGCAPLYYLCRRLLSEGKSVSAVFGFNTADEVMLTDEFSSLGVEPLVATLDGSRGTKGFVTDVLGEYAPKYDYFYCCGPMPMMKALAPMTASDGEFSLEERMGCGAGFCYGCSCQTTLGPRRVCKDGPVFKKDMMIW